MNPMDEPRRAIEAALRAGWKAMTALLLALVLVDRLAAFLRLGGAAAGLAAWLSMSRHFESLSRGVLDGRDLAYYLATSGVFLYLTAWNVRRRKWS